MKTQEVPHEIRGFLDVFRQVGNQYDYAEVFDDFLSMAVCAFAQATEEDWYFKTIKKYDKRDLDQFPKMLGAWMMIQSKAVQTKGWFDSLGMFYELLTSQSKSQRLGQFFTPDCICDVMAELNPPSKEEEQKILDPACGSGRILLASNALAPGRHWFMAQDLDFMCVKMCALNMMIHGLVGQVLHMDTIRMKYYTGFSINPYLRKFATPSIIRLNDLPEKVIEVPEVVAPERHQFTLEV